MIYGPSSVFQLARLYLVFFKLACGYSLIASILFLVLFCVVVSSLMVASMGFGRHFAFDVECRSLHTANLPALRNSPSAWSSHYLFILCPEPFCSIFEEEKASMLNLFFSRLLYFVFLSSTT
jgi:hypothetical protein